MIRTRRPNDPFDEIIRACIAGDEAVDKDKDNMLLSLCERGSNHGGPFHQALVENLDDFPGKKIQFLAREYLNSRDTFNYNEKYSERNGGTTLYYVLYNSSIKDSMTYAESFCEDVLKFKSNRNSKGEIEAWVSGVKPTIVLIDTNPNISNLGESNDYWMRHMKDYAQFRSIQLFEASSKPASSPQKIMKTGISLAYKAKLEADKEVELQRARHQAMLDARFSFKKMFTAIWNAIKAPFIKLGSLFSGLFKPTDGEKPLTVKSSMVSQNGTDSAEMQRQLRDAQSQDRKGLQSEQKHSSVKGPAEIVPRGEALLRQTRVSQFHAPEARQERELHQKVRDRLEKVFKLKGIDIPPYALCGVSKKLMLHPAKIQGDPNGIGDRDLIGKHFYEDNNRVSPFNQVELNGKGFDLKDDAETRKRIDAFVSKNTGYPIEYWIDLERINENQLKPTHRK